MKARGGRGSSYSEGIRGSDLSSISSNETEFESSDDEDLRIISLSEQDAAAFYQTRNDLPDFSTTHGPLIHQPGTTARCTLTWRQLKVAAKKYIARNYQQK